MYFYEILQKIMSEQDLTIADVAHLAELPDSTVRSIMNRKSKTVSLDVAFKLAEGLEIPIEYLAGKESLNSKIKTFSDVKQLNRILSSFERLNTLGMQAAVDRIEELTYVDKYKSDKLISTANKFNNQTDHVSDYSNINNEINKDDSHELEVLGKFMEEIQTLLKKQN